MNIQLIAVGTQDIGFLKFLVVAQNSRCQLQNPQYHLLGQHISNVVLVNSHKDLFIDFKSDGTISLGESNKFYPSTILRDTLSHTRMETRKVH